jgi:MoxR-like ATPase
VLATQNPIEQEGTYPLPEAQVDRFMLQVRLTYPDRDEELLILDRMATVAPALYVDKVLGPEDVFALRQALDSIYMDDRLKAYIVDVVRSTRKPADFGLDLGPFIQLGASPRGTIALALAARGQALLEGRAYVTPGDVKAVAPDVLRHRLGVTYEAEAEEVTPDTIVQRILDHLPVP